jgi:hypothetical protein
MALFVVMPFVGFWLGMQYAPEKIITISVPEPLSEKNEDSTVVGPSGNETFLNSETGDITNEYLNSNYKVIAIVPNIFKDDRNTDLYKYHELQVVTEKDGYSCGGMYDNELCFFFLKSNYAQASSSTYIGKWGNKFTSLDVESMRFVDPYTVQFKAYWGDGGETAKEEWALDISSGSTTLLSEDY